MNNIVIQKIELDNILNADQMVVIVNNLKKLLSKKEFKKGINRVYAWQYCRGDDFGTKLIELIAKSDENNRLKLFRAFPETVIAYLLWFNKEFNGTVFNDDNEFFECMRMKLSKIK